MTQPRRFVAVLGLALVASMARPTAQSSVLNRELLRDWIEMKASMAKLADAMPEDKYTFKSTSAQRDFAQQVLHVASANVTNLRFLKGKAVPPTINRTVVSKEPERARLWSVLQARL